MLGIGLNENNNLNYMKYYNYIFKLILYDEHRFLCKENEEFYHCKCYVIWEAYQMLPIAHWPVRVQGIGENMPSNMLSFINFEPLELYWTYFLALLISQKRIDPLWWINWLISQVY